MRTKVFRADDEEDVSQAAAVLARGGLLAFPTETVYGLGARSDMPEAVEKLLRVKGRPADKKMAVLVSDFEAAERYAGCLPELARRLARRFWPGPLTIVVESEGESTGLRCPGCEAARRLVELAAAPVFAPSANPTGLEPATNAKQVLAYFDGKIDAVLDGGPAQIGKPSTVVLVKESSIELIREGAIAFDEIRKATKEGRAERTG